MDGGDRGAHDRGRAVRGRAGLAGLRSARPVPPAWQPAARASHPDLGPLPLQAQPLRQVPRRQHLHRRAQQPMMEIYTNMAWPDDPYRTGQQLYPRPAPRLAAFTLESSPARGSLMTTSAAIVYLPAAPHPAGDRHRADPDVRIPRGQHHRRRRGGRPSRSRRPRPDPGPPPCSDIDRVHAVQRTRRPADAGRDHAARPVRRPGGMGRPPHASPGEGGHVRLPRRPAGPAIPGRRLPSQFP